jgi:hypothetical protein
VLQWERQVIVDSKAALSLVLVHEPGSGTDRRSLAVSIAFTTLTLLVASCSPTSSTSSEPATSQTPPAPVSVGASTPRGGELHALTALGVVDAITQAGFAAPNPRDATAQDCADIGCDQSIVTDTVSVKSFSTTRKAELYSVPNNLYQAETIVVSFAPTVPESEQSRYLTEIQKLVI